MSQDTSTSALLHPTDTFVHRHIGPGAQDTQTMLQALGYESLEGLMDTVVPGSIRMDGTLDMGPERSEHELLGELRTIAEKNQVFRSYIGLGYSGTITPGVILRNILENPGWYTQYTPYQAEISQGRLEMLLNFQTMVADLTGLPISNGSLLDEATAAAEAMAMCHRGRPRGSSAERFLIADDCHPQVIEVTKHRAEVLGLQVSVLPHTDFAFSEDIFGCLLSYPNTEGTVYDYKDLCDRAHASGAKVAVCADLLALTLLTPPGEFGADIAIGNSQRFGVPMGFGGPHAAYMSATEDLKRTMPGRIIGVSIDANENPALRMAMQTREQHIRRDRATSNICTAQVLLAVIAGAYGVYHGPEGIKAIGYRVATMTQALRDGLNQLGHDTGTATIFDTIRVRPEGLSEEEVLAKAVAKKINLRGMGDGTVCIALDETVVAKDLKDLLEIFGAGSIDLHSLVSNAKLNFPEALARTSGYLQHPNFNSFHSETEMLRYLRRLESRDLSLCQAMIPLGSCTMKLNATAEMIPVTWPEFGALHPFAPLDQATGYQKLFADLEAWLAEMTGFHGVSLQPNAGSQGEYAGLLVIRAYHQANDDAHRNICLIPTSAHGTNPASAVMAGMKVVAVRCDDEGNIDVADLREKAEANAENLAALMVTYPSTHGVFEDTITEVCDIIHKNGGQVYMDGANFNAMVGICQPGKFGPDVCHLNLHKTFAIPHGGGGPGMGPIATAPHLSPYLPGHPLTKVGGEKAIPAISSAPWGSAAVLPITWMYTALMGAEGLTKASQMAILNANYIAHRLENYFPVLYRGNKGLVAHECIVDLRPIKASSGISVEDVAKRLIDYGFHAPTMSWPVAGTLMIEPTESESLAELDRFCEAMISIWHEIQAVEKGEADAKDNLLTNSPHTAEMVLADDWSHPYSREAAAYPVAGLRDYKFWPPVARVDNAYGDRNLVCTCPSVEELAEG